jgi:hypothetical protein
MNYQYIHYSNILMENPYSPQNTVTISINGDQYLLYKHIIQKIKLIRNVMNDCSDNILEFKIDNAPSELIILIIDFLYSNNPEKLEKLQYSDMTRIISVMKYLLIKKSFIRSMIKQFSKETILLNIFEAPMCQETEHIYDVIKDDMFKEDDRFMSSDKKKYLKNILLNDTFSQNIKIKFANDVLFWNPGYLFMTILKTTINGSYSFVSNDKFFIFDGGISDYECMYIRLNNAYFTVQGNNNEGIIFILNYNEKKAISKTYYVDKCDNNVHILVDKSSLNESEISCDLKITFYTKYIIYSCMASLLVQLDREEINSIFG